MLAVLGWYRGRSEDREKELDGVTINKLLANAKSLVRVENWVGKFLGVLMRLPSSLVETAMSTIIKRRPLRMAQV
jgi:hypothetical protein